MRRMLQQSDPESRYQLNPIVMAPSQQGNYSGSNRQKDIVVTQERYLPRGQRPRIPAVAQTTNRQSQQSLWQESNPQQRQNQMLKSIAVPYQPKGPGKQRVVAPGRPPLVKRIQQQKNQYEPNHSYGQQGIGQQAIYGEGQQPGSYFQQNGAKSWQTQQKEKEIMAARAKRQKQILGMVQPYRPKAQIPPQATTSDDDTAQEDSSDESIGQGPSELVVEMPRRTLPPPITKVPPPPRRLSSTTVPRLDIGLSELLAKQKQVKPQEDPQRAEESTPDAEEE